MKSCQQSDKSAGSVKCREFLNKLGNCQLHGVQCQVQRMGS
jgi:hypothetical protein